jgi:hypothetical protein
MTLLNSPRLFSWKENLLQANQLTSRCLQNEEIRGGLNHLYFGFAWSKYAGGAGGGAIAEQHCPVSIMSVLFE